MMKQKDICERITNTGDLSKKNVNLHDEFQWKELYVGKRDW